MIIKEIREQLETSDKPIAKSFHIGEKFKVLLFGFKKGMKLVDHKAKHHTKLLVIEGDLIYHKEREDKREDIRLKQYDEVDIPANEKHSLGALKDSLVLLTQG